MVRTAYILSGLIVLFLMFQCTGPRYLQEPTREIADVEWQEDVYPIVENHCAPCHFPEEGKVKYLHRKDSVRKHIQEIVWRVQLSPDHKDYMPYKQKKPPITDSLLQVVLNWKAQGYPE